MQVGRRVLDATQRERLDRTIRPGHCAIDHPRFEKSLDLQVVHQVVRVKRRRVAGRALGFSEEQLLPAPLRFAGLGGIELSGDAEFGRGRKIKQRLKFRHEMHLTAALQNVRALLHRDHRIAIEISCALLKLREIFHRLQRTLGTEEPLDVHSAQRRCLDTMPEFLRPRVARQMRRSIGVPVGVAVQAAHAAMRSLRAAIIGGVELLLRKRSHQQTQTFELFGIQDTVEQLEEVIVRHQLAHRNITEIGPRRQVNGRGKLREKMIRHIQVQIEPGQVTRFLFHQFVDVKLGEDHPSFRMIRMRQRQESIRKNVLFQNALRGHGRELVPRCLGF